MSGVQKKEQIKGYAPVARKRQYALGFLPTSERPSKSILHAC